MNTYYNVQKWSVQTYNTGTSLWNTVTSWPRGSSSTFSKRYESNSQIIELADGSEGMFTPQNHYKNMPITFTWNHRIVTSTFKNNLETYRTDHTGIKITLHDNITIQGYLMSVEEIYPFTGATQQYEIVAEFKPFSIDGNAIES
jgi:hypothetical protein